MLAGEILLTKLETQSYKRKKKSSDQTKYMIVIEKTHRRINSHIFNNIQIIHTNCQKGINYPAEKKQANNL
jgi:hypothetical protein